jgi:hypothetical protein
MSTSRRGDLPKNQKELRAATAERLEAIVEAAERAAESVIDDAETQARKYLAQARAEVDRAAEGRISELAELIDSLLDQAVSLRREAEGLQATLEEAKSRIDPARSSDRGASEPEASPEDPASQEVPRLRAVTEPEGPASLPEARPVDAAGARLLATQMAVSGSSREEIESRLRNRFEIEDTTPILDAILGPEE